MAAAEEITVVSGDVYETALTTVAQQLGAQVAQNPMDIDRVHRLARVHDLRAQYRAACERASRVQHGPAVHTLLASLTKLAAGLSDCSAKVGPTVRCLQGGSNVLESEENLHTVLSRFDQCATTVAEIRGQLRTMDDLGTAIAELRGLRAQIELLSQSNGVDLQQPPVSSAAVLCLRF